ncbi:hypothetical protein PROFUN_03399 [Planoprotostelium fungivorum]|uniref:peptidylprolyl isomerase n=1 Tax=Planoprotostelium fungivorum TaxID=1890364 RepID=A0A2P6NWF4_9EUKA|nr:hypothetical protein PROFUN_03399 [Planoprotostelium fungivorum]
MQPKNDLPLPILICSSLPVNFPWGISMSSDDGIRSSIELGFGGVRTSDSRRHVGPPGNGLKTSKSNQNYTITQQTNMQTTTTQPRLQRRMSIVNRIFKNPTKSVSYEPSPISEETVSNLRQSRSDSHYTVPNTPRAVRIQSPIHETGDDVNGSPSQWEKYLPETMISPAFASKTNVSRVCILYNPHSGNKMGQKKADHAKMIFNQAGVHVDLIRLQYRGHAEELLSTMDVAPYDVVCVLGGDGTFHEAVNGYMKRKDTSRLYTPLAVLPGGTGNSMVLELMNTTHLRTAVEHVIRGISAPIDIASVYFPLSDKRMYSFNSLHWGLASEVNVLAEKLRWMGKAIRYGTASVLQMTRGKKQVTVVETTDADGHRQSQIGSFSLGIANNIQTAAKGMRIAPKAKLNDGLLDVVLISSSRLPHLARVGRKFYDGSHISLPYVQYRQVSSFSVVPFVDPSLGEDLENMSTGILDVDGELTGTTPFQCTMMRQSLRMLLGCSWCLTADVLTSCDTGRRRSKMNKNTVSPTTQKLFIACGFVALFLVARIESQRRAESAIVVDVKDSQHDPQLGITITKVVSCNKPASSGSQITVHYTVFDSSIGKPPFSFILGNRQVIEGWEKGLLGACEGEKRKIIIPHQMAYGEKGFGSVIPPLAELTFDVEVLQIKGSEGRVGMKLRPGQFIKSKSRSSVVIWLQQLSTCLRYITSPEPELMRRKVSRMETEIALAFTFILLSYYSSNGRFTTSARLQLSSVPDSGRAVSVCHLQGGCVPEDKASPMTEYLSSCATWSSTSYIQSLLDGGSRELSTSVDRDLDLLTSSSSPPTTPAAFATQSASYPTGCAGNDQTSLQASISGNTATYKTYIGSGSCSGTPANTETYTLGSVCTAGPAGIYYKGYTGSTFNPAPGTNDQITENFVGNSCGGTGGATIRYGVGCSTKACSAANGGSSKVVCLSQGQSYSAPNSGFAVTFSFALLAVAAVISLF